MKTLTAQNVSDTFRNCLFQEGEDTTGFVPALGIVNNVGFHPQRLEQHRQDIADMLGQLPEEFFEDSPEGGCSFLAGCMDYKGEQWTGFHLTMEQLFQLGLATGYVIEPIPHEVTMAIGMMPIYIIRSEVEGSEIKVVKPEPPAVEVISMSRDKRKAQIVVRQGAESRTLHVQRQGNGMYGNISGEQFALA